MVVWRFVCRFVIVLVCCLFICLCQLFARVCLCMFVVVLSCVLLVAGCDCLRLRFFVCLGCEVGLLMCCCFGVVSFFVWSLFVFVCLLYLFVLFDFVCLVARGCSLLFVVFFVFV